MDIVVRMMGGLGNQLFQYGYAKKLQNEYHANNVILDIREYEKYKVRNFELGSFKLNDSVIVTRNLNRNYKYDSLRYMYYFVNGTLKKLCNQNLDFLFPYLCKLGLFCTARKLYNYKLDKNYDTIFLYGFFQDIECVIDVKENLINELVRKGKSNNSYEELYCRMKNEKNSIAVSVRCGKDYANAGYNICTAEYYKQGIRNLTSGLKDYRIFVFADDILNAKKMFLDFNNITYVENFDAVDQMLLMKECRYFVISNSSFAWWGSYLSQYSDKIIYVPGFWYPNKKTKNTRLVYPNVRIL